MHVVALLILTLGVHALTADPDENRLFDDLLRDYNRLSRPVANHTQSITVKIDFVLQQIVDVDEKNQVIIFNAWIKYTWVDYKLSWSPKDYGGIEKIRFPPTMIWKPDILVYNSADSLFDSTYHSHILVYNSGETLWIPPGLIKTTCKIDITWFPFDDQACYIKFGSWTHNGYELDLTPENKLQGVDTSEYLKSGEWLLLSTPVERSEITYECCPEPYIDVRFIINIRRRTLYYVLNLILPSMLISLMTVLGFTLPPDAGEKITLDRTRLPSHCNWMRIINIRRRTLYYVLNLILPSMLISLMTVLKFTLPPDAGEKITLEITILLSVCIFLSYLSNMIPQTSEAVPLLGVYFTCCMLVVSASVVCTVVVLNMHYRTPDTHEMGAFARCVLLEWLPWLLMMKRPGQKLCTCKTPRGCLRRSSSSSSVAGSDSVFHQQHHNAAASSSAQLSPTSPHDRVNLATKLIGERKKSTASIRVPSYLESFLNEGNQGNRRRLTIAVANHWQEQIGLESQINQLVDPILADVVGGDALVPNEAYNNNDDMTPSDVGDGGAAVETSKTVGGKRKIDAATQALLLLVKRVHSELQFIVRRMHKADVDQDLISDWKFAAMVIDRLCLIIYSLFIVISTVMVFSAAPNLFKA